MNAPSHPVGVFHDIDIDAYHSGVGISKTGLDDINRSMAHYYAMHVDPNRPPRENEETTARLVGHLAHCAILEPDEFGKRYIMLPKDAPRRPTEAQWNAKKPSDDSRAAMDWWAGWNSNAAGRTTITAEQYDTAWRQSESVRRLPKVAEALSSGYAEASAYWIDPETGVLCRCRPDWTHECSGGTILLDVKTCGNASPDEFARQCARMRYHVQDAFYSDGFAAASGIEVAQFFFVAVEVAYPFAPSIVTLDDDSKEQGRRDYRENLARYAASLRTDKWPAYGENVSVIRLPAYAFDEEEMEIGYV